MKHEYRKHELELYGPKQTARLISVPSLNYICLSGIGNPNLPSFSNKIEALFTVAYTLRMFPKKGVIIPNFNEYTVYPLEGVWDLTERGRKESHLNKDELVYTIMIRQPAFITEEIFKQAIEVSKLKNTEIKDIFWQCTKPSQCVQILHIGPYETEPESFEKINDYCVKNRVTRLSHIHREIYLSDFRKTNMESLKTILQVEVN